MKQKYQEEGLNNHLKFLFVMGNKDLTSLIISLMIIGFGLWIVALAENKLVQALIGAIIVGMGLYGLNKTIK